MSQRDKEGHVSEILRSIQLALKWAERARGGGDVANLLTDGCNGGDGQGCEDDVNRRDSQARVDGV